MNTENKNGLFYQPFFRQPHGGGSDRTASPFSSLLPSRLESPGTSLETAVACVIVRQPVGADTSGSRPPAEFSSRTPRAERKVFKQEPTKFTENNTFLHPSVIEEFCFFCCGLNFLFKFTALYLSSIVYHRGGPVRSFTSWPRHSTAARPTGESHLLPCPRLLICKVGK